MPVANEARIGRSFSVAVFARRPHAHVGNSCAIDPTRARLERTVQGRRGSRMHRLPRWPKSRDAEHRQKRRLGTPSR